MSDTIAGRTMAEWTTLSRRDDACERIVPSDLRALLGEIARLRAPDRSREGLEAELRTALKRIAGSAEAFLRHFNPHDFAEDKAQQYFSLSDQVAFAKRLLAVTPPAPDASPVAKDWLAFNDPFFTDGEPYCNTVRFISKADAIAQRKRQHKEVAGADFPGTDNEALFEFISVNWAWEVPSPLPAPDASGGRDGAAEERALRARCQHVANTIMQDAMLRQNSAVDTLFSFVSKEIKAAIEAGDHLPKPGGSDA